MDRSAIIDKIVVTMVAVSIAIWLVNCKIFKTKTLSPKAETIILIALIGCTPWITYSAWAKQYGIPMVNLCGALAPNGTSGDIISNHLHTSKLLAANRLG